MPSRQLLISLILVLAGASCGDPSLPPKATAVPEGSAASAATSNARVEAWAIATGTALKLTDLAQLTKPAPTQAEDTPTETMTPEIAPLSPTVSASTAPAVSTPQPRASATTSRRPPTSVPPTKTLSAQDCYNKACQWELVAPDGHDRWPETCTNLGLDNLCYITFSNGHVTDTFGWPVIWSADSKFLAVPEGGNHDSYAAGYGIWDMTAGTRVTRFDYDAGRQWWSPTGHTLAYVKEAQRGHFEFHLLDAATGGDKPTRQCPGWATSQLKNSDYFDWRTVCDNWTPPAGEAVIVDFAVEPQEIDPGQSVTIVWSSSGATSARIEQSTANGTPVDPITVPVSGTLSVTIPAEARTSHAFDLVVADDAGHTDRRSRLIYLRCPEAFFFASAPPPASAGCPLKSPALVAAAGQAFEHGRMLWLAPVAAAHSVSGADQNASIYVLYDQGATDSWPTWQRYDDLWTTAEPEQDPTFEPPAGRLQPRRGFGTVWRADATLRDKLGWALAPEQGFQGAYQVQWDFGNRPGNFYLRAADGSVLDLTQAGYWSVWHP